MAALRKFIEDLGPIIITLLVIGLGFLAFMSNRGMFDKITAKSNDTMNSMVESNITQYNRSDIPGNEVLNAISSFMNSSDEIYIEVKNASSDVVYLYPNRQITSDQRQTSAEVLEALKKAKQKGAAEYISPKSKYTGTVQYHPDDDTVIVGILFEKQ